MQQIGELSGKRGIRLRQFFRQLVAFERHALVLDPATCILLTRDDHAVTITEPNCRRLQPVAAEGRVVGLATRARSFRRPQYRIKGSGSCSSGRRSSSLGCSLDVADQVFEDIALGPVRERVGDPRIEIGLLHAQPPAPNDPGPKPVPLVVFHAFDSRTL